MGGAVIGVDVGTRSARAGVFDDEGRLLASAKRPIAIWREAGEIVEHSSADIWGAASAAVRDAVSASGPRAEAIRRPRLRRHLLARRARRCRRALPVGPSGDPRRDTIVWMDHRAIEEAARDQRRRARSAALRRRRDLARNAGAEAAWLARTRAANFRASRAFLRPHRLSHLSRHRLAGALGLHGRPASGPISLTSDGGRRIFSTASGSAPWAAPGSSGSAPRWSSREPRSGGGSAPRPRGHGTAARHSGRGRADRRPCRRRRDDGRLARRR